jgi:hypothetical protein
LRKLKEIEESDLFYYNCCCRYCCGVGKKEEVKDDNEDLVAKTK